MKVLPANWKKWLIHYWAGRYPERLGHLWSPEGTITVYPHLSYALDNGKFAATVGVANAYGWQYAPNHRPLKWAVEHAGVQYPAKLLISRANIWVNGAPWQSRLFSGGRDCHKFLSDRGFSIAPLDRRRLA
ncbi:hypothetical protein PN498_26780 [Oscillatoria sp. CS-180]|uniref:hypothetical protein n=1 Tax=Oscillatoria sp. CS-180 TaxID=3021720 RepID=UPI00232DA377|nr:hypothetical protein [Oscillatoria sp. CS-180]MDB9529625.1 hypothetical protein [Oscillatoria sp. CS-180]